jgi:hypothetical protein
VRATEFKIGVPGFKKWNQRYSKVPAPMDIGFAGAKLCVLMIYLFATLLACSVADSHANDTKAQQYSKDYKTFPAGSPEAVVTSFVEYADLGKGANREADERFPLFWSLTELGEVPDNSQRLIINSYKVDGKNTLPTGDVIVWLKIDVRAIHLSSCDSGRSSAYNYQMNNCEWRDRTVIIHNSTSGREYPVSTADTQAFIQYVFGNSETGKAILSKKKGMYAIPKATREWKFKIRLVKKKGKWLISQDSVPIEVSYIDDEIKSYRSMVRHGNEAIEICEGKRIPDKNSFYYAKETRGKKCKANLDIIKNNVIILKSLEYARED